MDEDPVDTLWDSSCHLQSNRFRCHKPQQRNLLSSCNRRHHFSRDSYQSSLSCPSICGHQFVSDSQLQRLSSTSQLYCTGNKTKILPRSCHRPLHDSTAPRWLPRILSSHCLSWMLAIVFLFMCFPNIVLSSGTCSQWWCASNDTACSIAASESLFCNCTFRGSDDNITRIICLGSNDTNCSSDICQAWTTCHSDNAASPPSSCRCSGYNETTCSYSASPFTTESPVTSSAHPTTRPTATVATTTVTAQNLCDLTSPCQNNGTCYANSSGFYCNCTAEFTGVNCTVPTNACSSVPCLNNGTCSNTDVGSGYNCSCLPVYNGTRCEYATCVGIQCQHGAVCAVVDNGTKWECNCSSHLEGKLCELPKPCNVSLCSYNGNCQYNFDGTPNCTCNNGYTDNDCSRLTNVSVCDPSPCLHGGNCTAVNSSMSYKCHCTPEYLGKNCTVFDLCSVRPCKNNATCVTNLNDGSYICNCTENYTGANCTEIVDACVSSPCQNNGTCYYTPDKKINCTCLPGYYGDDCKNYNPCYSQPCQHGGNCSMSSQDTGYVCFCPAGYTGVECETAEKVASETPPVGLIVGLTVGLTCAVLLVIAMVIFIKYAQSKRAKHGTYHPSQQEMAGSRLDFSNAIKPPPEERLI